MSSSNDDSPVGASGGPPSSGGKARSATPGMPTASEFTELFGKFMTQFMENMQVNAQASQAVTHMKDFPSFDPAKELWRDYYNRFETYFEAKSFSQAKKAIIFMDLQTPEIQKRVLTAANTIDSAIVGPRQLTIKMVTDVMKANFEDEEFLIRERHKFWLSMGRKSGETIPQLASRIEEDGSTCDFRSVTNCQDESYRTRFLCSLENKSLLRAIFNQEALASKTFHELVKFAQKYEDAEKAASKTIESASTSASHSPVHKVTKAQSQRFRPPSTGKNKLDKSRPRVCFRCDSPNHSSDDCRFKTAVCHYCQIVGHIEPACNKKKQGQPRRVNVIAVNDKVNRIAPITTQLMVFGHPTMFELDCGSGANFIDVSTWQSMGSPTLANDKPRFTSASNHAVPTIGHFQTVVNGVDITFFVSKVKNLKIIGREGLRDLRLSVDEHLGVRAISADYSTLQRDCRKLCDEFPELFKPGLGRLKKFELDVEFLPDAKPVFCKPRPVPFAIMEDLAASYQQGIDRGVWTRTQFNEWGTPVVPIRKALLPGQSKAKLRVCGDYSVSVNPQLATHRYQMPLPDDLMRRLSGGFGFSKVDLADAYNQIVLSDDSRRKLALSTHQGVLLQNRLCFGISSAPGYFQEIMDKLTADLTGVSVFLDDILVSGHDAPSHVNNLRRLLQRLSDNGLKCRLEKCSFAQPTVEYLGHTLSADGVSKGQKLDAVLAMPPPTNVAQLRSFLGHVRFYSKFMPPSLASILEPFHRLLRQDSSWRWSSAEQAVFDKVKALLSSEKVLVHYDPRLPVGIACDASESGIGAVLFHVVSGDERPIYNVSKTLTACQRKYSQIQKEALAIVFALRKFHQFLYGRHFTIVTDHRPLLALFGPTNGTPTMAANRLARWSLELSQYDYEIVYRKTNDHGNADGLSRLPAGADSRFDGEENGEDEMAVLQIETVDNQLNDSRQLAKETTRDPVVSQVIRFVQNGWPGHFQGKNENELKCFKQIDDFLSVSGNCLFFGIRIVIPKSLQSAALELLHIGHFGTSRMKQLARSSVYWPGIDKDIEVLVKSCARCQANANDPPSASVHPWSLPEKPWIRIHADHAISFLGSDWLVIVDSFSKYPCIHPVNSTSSAMTIKILEEDFSHFGYPIVLVTDNATSFTSEEFQSYCRSKAITHLTDAPYRASTNGIAERMIQTFKRHVERSHLPVRQATLEFLRIFRRIPLANGRSPSELLNGRTIRTEIDLVHPNTWVDQMRLAQRPQEQQQNRFTAGQPVWVRNFLNSDSNKWVQATVISVSGERHVLVQFVNGALAKRHIDQVRPGGSDHQIHVDQGQRTETQGPRRSPRLANASS